MKLTLTIEGDASALALVIASLETLPLTSPIVAGVAPANPVMPEVAAAAPTLPGVPAMPPSAPAAPVAPATSIPAAPTDDDDGPDNANAPAIDGTGLPWDERIHAKSKALNADNTWRSRRNLDANVKAAVEAELRARGGIPVAPAMPAPAPIAAPPAMPVAPPVAAPAPVPAPPPLQAAVDAAIAHVPKPNPTNIKDFMEQLQEQFNNRDANGAPVVHAEYLAQLTARINQAATENGTPTNMGTITDLDKFPHLISYTVDVMRKDGTWR